MSVATSVGPGLDRKTAARLTDAPARELALSHAPPIFPGRESAYIAFQTILEPLIVRFVCA
jgi:hypothetical protein